MTSCAVRSQGDCHVIPSVQCNSSPGLTVSWPSLNAAKSIQSTPLLSSPPLSHSCNVLCCFLTLDQGGECSFYPLKFPAELAPASFLRTHLSSSPFQFRLFLSLLCWPHLLKLLAVGWWLSLVIHFLHPLLALQLHAQFCSAWTLEFESLLFVCLQFNPGCLNSQISNLT